MSETAPKAKKQGGQSSGCVVMLAVIIAVAVVVFKGCGSSSNGGGGQSDIATGIQVLQQFDRDHGNGSADSSAYQAALSMASAKCTNPVKDVARFVENSYTDLVSNGVEDETALSVLQHLNASIPDGSRMDCQGVLAAYLALREG